MEKSGDRPTHQEHKDTDIKNSEKESLKWNKRNAHFYKLLFKKANVSKETPAGESCLPKKARICSEQGSGDQSATKDKIQSGSSECNLSSTEFEEYWVPVHLSFMQIEQYCSILTSNSDTLSSLPRKSSLNDIIRQIQKCCDHPYLVDPTLRKSAKEPSLTDDPLAAEINVSGKLQVFDKLLLEIKRCGLKALVLFKSAFSSEKISTGHILDDLVHQRFGENSYVYIPGNKKESLEAFNNADSERFVCLCDYHACQSSVRLSRVDVVIIFNSDRNPSNDIKSLKKITIDSPCERVNVFRLYSAFTVEEKALILSKEGTVVDKYISSSVCHQLLAWGATYLFSKLQSCADSGPQSFIDDLVHELSSLLRPTGVKVGPTEHSIISNATMHSGAYSESILLFGETESRTKEDYSVVEYLVANSPSDFWSNLVNESQPGPEKPCSRLSRRVQEPKRTRIEGENAAIIPSFVRSKQRSKRKCIKNLGRKPAACENAAPASISDSIAVDLGTNGGQQSQPDQPAPLPPHTLETEVERIRKEREQVVKSHQEKESMLLAECEKEVSEVQKKYDGLIDDSKTRSKNLDIVLKNYQRIVKANKFLAEILAQSLQDTSTLKTAQKETSTLIIPTIHASARVQSTTPTTLAGSGLVRFPAPHIRSNPSLFPSLHNRLNSGEPSLEPLLTLPSTQTVDKQCPV